MEKITDPATVEHAVGLSTPQQAEGTAFSDEQLTLEKRRLKVALTKYEEDFQALHNRKATREERMRERGAEYKRYAELKTLLGCPDSPRCFSPK
jgi:hypothetical protein